MISEETINELSLDTLSQAARVAMTKRDAAEEHQIMGEETETDRKIY